MLVQKPLGILHRPKDVFTNHSNSVRFSPYLIEKDADFDVLNNGLEVIIASRILMLVLLFILILS